MPRLIAKESFPYAGRNVAIGDEFDASDADARTLKLLRKATDAPQPKAPEPQSNQVQTAAMKSEADELFGEQNKPKRTRYRRSDMRPED